MESGPLKIGIACFPLIGGSGILATALGSELARRGHEVYFFSYAQPVRLDLPQEGLHFHLVDFANNALFPCPDYTLPLAVKNGGSGSFPAARSFSCSLRGATRTGCVFSLADRRTVCSAHHHNFARKRYHSAGAGSRLSHRHRACLGAFRCSNGGFRKPSGPNPGNLSFETTD